MLSALILEPVTLIAACGEPLAAEVVSAASTLTLPSFFGTSIAMLVNVTEVTPVTLRASLPVAASSVIVPAPSNVTLWFGSSWLDVLPP